MVYILIGAIGAVALIALYGAEIHENNQRIMRGEPPKVHHDITDWPDPVEVIDRTRWRK